MLNGIDGIENNVNTENISNSCNISVREKSMDEIDEIVMWPKKQTKQRKRKVKHLP